MNSHENVASFVENIFNADGGTHLTGFKTAFTTVMNGYARELGILKDERPEFYRTGYPQQDDGCHFRQAPNPRFEGRPNKAGQPEASRAVAKVISDEAPHYFDRNLEALKAILGCVEKSAKIRKSEEKARTNLLTRQKFSLTNGKLANCSAGKPINARSLSSREIRGRFLQKTARNRTYQAILPDRGKNPQC